MDDLFELGAIDILALSDDGVVIHNADAKGGEDVSDGQMPDDDTRLPNGKPLPKRIAILKIGENKFTKDGKDGSFDISPEDADQIIENHKKRQRDLAVDFEHSSIKDGKSPAGAWVSDLKKVGNNIVAIFKMFTPEAKADLKSGAYRYLSPVVQFKDGKPNSVHSVAFTSHPSLWSAPDMLSCSDVTLNEFQKTLNAVDGIYAAFSDVASDLASAMSKAEEKAKANPELMQKYLAVKAKIEGMASAESFADPAMPQGGYPPIDALQPPPGMAQAVASQMTQPPAPVAPVGQPQAVPLTGDHAAIDGILKNTQMSDADKSAAIDKYAQSNDPATRNAALAAKSQLAPVAVPKQIATQPNPGDTAMAASDLSLKQIANLIGFSDTTAEPEKVEQRIGQMKNVCLAVNQFFTGNGVASFADYEAKQKAVISKKDSEIKDLNDKLTLSDFESTISQFIREGKITAATKDFEMKAIKGMGKKDYVEAMAKRPVIVPLSDSVEVSDALSSPKMGNEKATSAILLSDNVSALVSALGLTNADIDGSMASDSFRMQS